MSESAVLFEELPADKSGKKIAVATLNAERSLNSLSLEMIKLLGPKLSEWESDPAVVAVFLQGAGEKAFCAGGDVVALHQSSAAYGGQLPDDNATVFFEHEYRLDYQIHTYKKPLVVWGSGIVMGGGLGLLVGASHRVVTETTRMAMPEVTIGLYPDVAGSWFLNRTPGRTGMFLGLTGASFNGADAIYLGLADRFVHSDTKTGLLASLVKADWTESEKQNHVLISTLLREREKDAQSIKPDSNVQAHYDSIQALTDADTIPDLFDLITSYQGDDQWLSKAAEGLAKGCPVTPYLVKEQLRRAKHMSLADVFRMELTMSVNCAVYGHVKEGVRALLIDKDRNPQWQPSTVTDVTADQVDAMFSDPWPDHPLADLGRSG